MCNIMMSYFKRNQKVQRNERQSRSERADPSRSEQADQSMIGAIIVEKIRDGEIRLQKTEMKGMIILEKRGVKASGEKRGRLEQSKNITERQKIRSKRENKSIVRRSEGGVRKVVCIRKEQEVQYRTTESEEKIRPEKVAKQQPRSTRNDGR